MTFDEMCIRYISAAFKFSKTKKMASRFVLVCICDCANDDGVAWPSIKTIAQRCAMSERAVQNAIKELIAVGDLSKSKEGGFIKGKNVSNTYQILLPGERDAPGEGDSSGAHHAPHGVNNVHHRGERSDIDGVNHVHPNRHIEPSIEPSEKEPYLNSSATASKTQEKKTRNPTLEEFTAYGASKGVSEKDCKDQYEIWAEADWHDLLNNPIKHWRAKLLNFHNSGYLPSDKRKNSHNRSTKKRDPQIPQPV